MSKKNQTPEEETLQTSDSLQELEETKTEIAKPEVKQKAETKNKSEKTFTREEVQELIRESVKQAITEKNLSEKEQKKIKKVKEHNAHVSRFDAKWVVDFVDQNKDEYRQEPVHAFNLFDEKTKQMVPFIELKFHDNSTKLVPLFTYIKNRTQIFCKIIEREKIDISYSHGDVEQKKENNKGLLEGTGVIVDQEVEMYKEVFHVETPDGTKLSLPDYVIA